MDDHHVLGVCTTRCGCLKAMLGRLCTRLHVVTSACSTLHSRLKARRRVQHVGLLPLIAVGKSARVVTAHRQLRRER